jgi:hypothetical protein
MSPRKSAPPAEADKATSSRVKPIRTQRESEGQLDLLFETFLPVTPNSHSRYPSLFTRVPLFEPLQDRSERDTKGWGPNDADTYETGDLRIERFGPGLSIYDEDTLIAILQLGAERSLRGPRSMINRTLKTVDGRGDGDPNAIEEVLMGSVTPFKVNRYLLRGTGGEALKQCQQSIDRLAVTQLLFIFEKAQKKMSAKFFEYLADFDAKENTYFRIDPVMVKLLREYAEFDLTLRRKLSDTGKSVHRYLSGQDADNRIPLADLMHHISYQGEMKEFKRVLTGGRGNYKGQLEILKDEQWLLDFEITGTSRKTPFVLHTRRNIEKASGVIYIEHESPQQLLESVRD